MGDLFLGCCGWNYPDTPDKGGWTEVFYPNKDIKRLRYYSQFFNTAEMDSTFYERLNMTKGTFIGMTGATPENFEFSIKVPETMTHIKRLDIKKGAMTSFDELLDKISPLKTTNKLGTILFQLPPSFTVTDFKNIEQFLDRLPASDGYDYAVEFRHPSWGIEGPWEMVRHSNIVAAMTDSPPSENLEDLSDVIVTADHSLIRFHGRNTRDHYWYNYLYSEQELKPWIGKVGELRKQTKILYVYFNNHYGGKAVLSALQFRALVGNSLSETETNALEHMFVQFWFNLNGWLSFIFILDMIY
jgi:uncharacterized protein YecE (DUF72 family)